jgi:hypothetical protein
MVKKFYKYLALPISENLNDNNKGKIFCLTDTDSNMRTKDLNQDPSLKKHLLIKRLAVGDNNTTTLIRFEVEEKRDPIDIEKSLNPLIFIKILEDLNVKGSFLINQENILNPIGNTTIENLRNFDIGSYFKTEEVKNNFAKKYVETMCAMEEPEPFIPDWIEEIRKFYRQNT